MYYSKRAEWDEKFREYCERNGFLYCLLNAISWMETEDEGRKLLEQLKTEDRKDAKVRV